MQSLQIEDGKQKLADGNMHYWAVGKGPTVVLLHSMAASVRSWSQVLEPLAEKYAVYALDMMGQGDSDKPKKDYKIEDYARCVVEFLKAKGVRKASIIGNSVGAVLTVELAATNRDLVEKAVLVGCPCRDTEQERKEALELSKAQYDAKGNPLPRSLEDLKQHYVHVSPELQKQVNEDRAKAGVWAWKANVANNSYDIGRKLGSVRCPTLILFGDKDLLRPKEKVLQERIRGSKLVIIPEAGHLPQIDNPQAVLEAVLPFLK